ncbi:exodeoxyribonuclease V subunit gamma [Rhabdothermincola salaria]|uniref:exodeoxyribonuclease V subunit gamma n=1 Tax=Rhabdothermincola salaria TaxID=2903142 RepID=UPI001E4E19E3|nr:exodeoxyribonuclease V subunit gamma [Rhabdothermincola salaria]MCD9623990.1 exodeoxyribonuclease V subunit gamma [Rhabdothermincola salaria]
MHLSVAGSLEPLADQLADALAVPLDDPFAREVVVVPGDGLRRWLTGRLAARLGASAPGAGDGIVANVDFVFPATLVRRALGDRCGLGSWSVGPLTWAVYEALGDEPDHFGQSPDAVRARAIADLFDRYALHRPTMVQRWSLGDDVDAVGATLAPPHRWQPALWREVRADLGGTSDAERLGALVAELRRAGTVAGVVVAQLLPPRVFLFGLASLPTPQLDVLDALSAHVDVHVLAPAASPARWHRLRHELGEAERVSRPLPRSEDDFAAQGGHPLVDSWGRTSREAHLLLLETATAADASVDAPTAAGPEAEPSSLLQRLQHDVAGDAAPPGPPPPGGLDRRLVVSRGDRSVRWHRCYGTARQVEVLRDAILHLLQDDDLALEPRHIAVLCTDIERFAPLVEATFAGDPAHGLPAVPVRVADRTLRQDTPLLDAVGGLLDLLDGRFRSSEVLGLLARPPVRDRFGLEPADLDRIADWVEQTNVRWGLGPEHHADFGIPADLEVHTWRAGLDQLLLGAAMADDGVRLGPDDVVPFADVEGRDVEIAGRLADFVHRLDLAVEGLRRAAPVHAWTERLAAAVGDLCRLPDDEAWQWGRLERLLADFASEATVDGEPRPTQVAAFDLAALVRARLGGGGGRARFGTGAVTVSSLTAQRGVPHRVICLLGLDDGTGAGALAAAEDLTADPPCVGDRDPRSEARAQLLDAVMAAGERLVIVSDGHDVRSNAPVPPAVPVAELLDVLDATARVEGSEDAVRAAITVDHPRQSWSERNFLTRGLDDDGPWGFDTVALEAASARRGGAAPVPRGQSFLVEPLAPLDDGGVVTVAQLLAACRNPAQVLLRDRLGVSLPEAASARDDLIPFTLGPLERWKVSDELLTHRLRGGAAWDSRALAQWSRAQRRRGSVPPLAFGDESLDAACEQVDDLVSAATVVAGGALADPESVTIDVSVTGADGAPVRIVGQLDGIVGAQHLTLTASRLKDRDLLVAWVQAALLHAHDPSVAWEVALVGRARKGGGVAVERVALRTPGDAPEVLRVAIDLHRRASCDAVPAFAATTRAYHEGGPSAAGAIYVSKHPGVGEAGDRFVAELFGTDPEVVLAQPRRPDESGEGWGDHESRLACWAERLWGTFERTALLVLGTADLDASGDATADAVAGPSGVSGAP